jgi:2,5-diketo-D-gluconate reductase A
MAAMSAMTENGVVLRGGVPIPPVGFGTSPLTDEEIEKLLPKAVEAGFRLFDTAYSYKNEEGVGRAVRESSVPREKLFVTTKLNAEWHGVQEAQDAYADSLARLGLDYADLYLIHWPNPFHDRFVQAWEGMVTLLEAGRVRAIGVSNFKPAHIDRLIAATGVVPALNQIQLNPLVPRTDLLAYHREHGIQLEAWSPLGQGASDLLTSPTIGAIADRLGRTPGQVILRWHLELGVLPVVRTRSPARMPENLALFDFSLGPQEMDEIAQLDRGTGPTLDSDLFGH